MSKILDWLLVLVIGAMLLIAAFYVVSSPPLWAWCLDRLDARGWTHWTWTGVVVALLVVLAGIRFWPEKKCAKPAPRPTVLVPCPSPKGQADASVAALTSDVGGISVGDERVE
jgi:hypothetical protein